MPDLVIHLLRGREDKDCASSQRIWNRYGVHQGALDTNRREGALKGHLLGVEA